MRALSTGIGLAVASLGALALVTAGRETRMEPVQRGGCLDTRRRRMLDGITQPVAGPVFDSTRESKRAKRRRVARERLSSQGVK